MKRKNRREKKKRRRVRKRKCRRRRRCQKKKRMFPVGPRSPDMSLWETRDKASAEGGPFMKDAEIQTLGCVGQA